MTLLLPAPQAVIELVRCGCAKSRCSTNRRSCHKAQLSCIDLCGCSDDDDRCENQGDEAANDDEECEIDHSDT